jgi:FkbM family methyltransferase
MIQSADTLYDILRPQRLTSVVDIGANPIDGPAPYRPMLDDGLCTVIGFEPQQPALDELSRRKGPLEQYLPYAVGDGTTRTLHICRASGMTSLLEPNPTYLRLFADFPELATIERKETTRTRRLDDIDEIQNLDFLKIDVQGAELDVFRSGYSKLAMAVAIQVEVRFITFYRDEPPIGAIDAEMRSLGFLPHCFVAVKRWPIAPTIVDGQRRKPLHQLLGADMLYVRDFSQSENMSAEQWKHLAMVVHHCYGSFDLAYRAVSMVAALGGVGADAPARYLANLRSRNPSQPASTPLDRNML